MAIGARYRPRQPAQAAAECQIGAFDLGQAEARGIARDDQVAGERDLEPAAERRAFHRRDPRLGARQIDEAGKSAGGGAAARGGIGGDLLHVGAGAEGAARRRRSAPRP